MCKAATPAVQQQQKQQQQQQQPPPPPFNPFQPALQPPPPYQPPWMQQQQPAPRVSPQSESPPGDVKQLKKQIRGLKAAQAIPGQQPSELAARAQQIDGLESDLEERERKYHKYGHW